MAQETASWQMNGFADTTLTPGLTRVTVTGGDLSNALVMVSQNSPLVFPDIPASANPYTGTAQLLDNSPQEVPIGAPATRTFTVVNRVATPSDLVFTAG